MDGRRMCLGQNFVVTEFKVVLVVLVKNFVFELRDGVDSKIEIGRGLLPRVRGDASYLCVCDRTLPEVGTLKETTVPH
ncbi:hypothetical protein L210DRAFT_2857572 [Boletus edulis BED1]|uniref:Cytochrome P450 n=1 Tax=Boletus edulis BED1 TaxID=1328754 RepID=A0AAD4GAJ5_BOLED|nr:hypothetical protein L210DRAFT_2857572 [Boletus edulis BED1]